MIRFFYNLSPNPMKVALCLEEMGLPYETVPVDTRQGAQFDPAYTAINPNGKVPAIVDGDVTVFDSNAILLYLAGKTGRFLPEGEPVRGEMLSWLMFVATGIGPFSGQCVHFRHFAQDGGAYATERYAFEARRHWGILDQRLAGRTYVLGDSYTIVDMAVWGWARMVPFVLGETAFADLPNVKRLLDAINARPAAQAAEALKEPPHLQGRDGRRKPGASCSRPRGAPPEPAPPGSGWLPASRCASGHREHRQGDGERAGRHPLRAERQAGGEAETEGETEKRGLEAAVDPIHGGPLLRGTARMRRSG